MSSPMRALRQIAGFVVTIIEQIRASRILENPTFAELRNARDSHFQRQRDRAPTAQRQGDRAPMAQWQGEEWQEEEDTVLDAEEEFGWEEEVQRQATQTRDITREDIEETYARQTVAGNAEPRASEAGTYVSEETTRRRLYETTERQAAVLENRRREERISGTKSTNEGEKTFVCLLACLAYADTTASISAVGDTANVMDNPQTLEKHSAFQLVSIPSDEEIQLAKDRVQYVEGLFHFAVTGVSGAGKSSLINAFRGLRNRDEGAAPTGVVETTMDISRFPDPNPQNPFVWYDVPGSGTLSTPDWQYFNAQGLYVFDCIIVLFDTRFTMTDLAMLVNCRRFNIPTYIVRSKSDTHIRNMMKDSGYDSDEDEDHSSRNAMYGSAREQYIAETRATVRLNLQEASLPDQRVYIVAHSTMVSTVRERTLSEKTIDELELMRDLFREAQSRRCTGTRSPTYEI
ncbi:hypothetical protein AZE42_03204 [Rhizopogon vesiculosus]|uniref:IRG-type G domain-containing protein n=1 Tax=Rhizopogon vesiculosus TaxID=180088 RepID=A0A1J8QCZ4_9AGAM|nr:hypothetical protein AZE42_03204 [Rhizopogon vesiculosus]